MQNIDNFFTSTIQSDSNEAFSSLNTLQSPPPHIPYPEIDPRIWNDVMSNVHITPQELQDFEAFGPYNTTNTSFYDSFDNSQLQPLPASSFFSSASNLAASPRPVPPPSMPSTTTSNQQISATILNINSKLKNFQLPTSNVPSEMNSLVVPMRANFASLSASSSYASSDSDSEAPEPNFGSLGGSHGSHPALSELFKKESELVATGGGPSNRKFLNVAPYFRFSQRKAAKLLDIPCSTLSKRWRDATGNKKWPYRVVSKMEKEINSIMQNINHSGQRDPRFEGKLTYLSGKIEQELTPVYVGL